METRPRGYVPEEKIDLEVEFNKVMETTVFNTALSPVKEFPTFTNIASLGNARDFYSVEEEEILKKGEASRNWAMMKEMSTGSKEVGLTEEEIRKIPDAVGFYLQFAKFIEIYPEKGRELLTDSLWASYERICLAVDWEHTSILDHAKSYSREYMESHNKRYNEIEVMRDKVYEGEENVLVAYHVEYQHLARGADATKIFLGEDSREARWVERACGEKKKDFYKHMVCLSYLKTRYPDIE
jgi:hypothetical protein